MGTGDKLKEKGDSVMLGEAFCCHGLGLLIPIYGPQSSGLCTGLHTPDLSPTKHLYDMSPAYSTK